MTDLKLLLNEKRFPTFLFCVAFLARIGYLLFLQDNYFFYEHPSSDVLYYQHWANDIVKGHWIGQSTFYGLPLFPYTLAILKIFSFGSNFLLKIYFLLLGSLNCALVYNITKTVFDRRIGCLASLLCALNFYLIYYDWLMMPVTLIIFLTLVVTSQLLKLDSLSKKEQFYLGLLLGLTIIGDGKFLFFAILYFIYVFFKNQKEGLTKLIIRVFPIALGIFLILFSVTLRNKLVGGNWIFITAQSGLSFFIGNNPQSDGYYTNPDFIRPDHSGQDEDLQIYTQLVTNRALNATEINQFWRNRAIQFIVQNPAQYGKLLVTKFRIFLTDTEIAHDIDLLLQGEWKSRLDFNPFFIICPLAMIGGIIAFRKREYQLNFFALIILSQLIFTLLFFLNTRHRVTILPFLIIFESFFIIWLFDCFKKKQFKKSLLTLIVIPLYFFLCPRVLQSNDVINYIRFANAGPIYAAKGYYKKAQNSYFSALKYQPFDTNTLYNLANSYLNEGNYSSALIYYKKVLTLNSTHIDALFNLGYIYEQTNQLDQALSVYNSLLNIQGGSPDIYFRLATVYGHKGNCNSSNHYYSEILKISPHLKDEITPLISKCR